MTVTIEQLAIIRRATRHFVQTGEVRPEDEHALRRAGLHPATHDLLPMSDRRASHLAQALFLAAPSAVLRWSPWVLGWLAFGAMCYQWGAIAATRVCLGG